MIVETVQLELTWAQYTLLTEIVKDKAYETDTPKLKLLFINLYNKRRIIKNII